MAKTTLTKNLRLKISSDLTADAKYNLEKLDSLAGMIQLTTGNNTEIKSSGTIKLLPNSADIGGDGQGGTVSLGSAEQPLESLTIHAEEFLMGDNGALATIEGTQTLKNKTISAAENTIAGITNSSIANGAAIDGTKITPTFGSQPIETSQLLRFTNGSNQTSLRQASSGQTSSFTFFLPPSTGSTGQVLQTDGNGILSWANSTSGALAGLADVSLGTPGGRDVLSFNSDTGLWNSLKTYYSTSWIPADGVTKVVTHSLGTTKVIVQVQDESNQIIEVDIQSTSVNIVTMNSTQAPSGTWTILIHSLL